MVKDPDDLAWLEASRPLDENLTDEDWLCLKRAAERLVVLRRQPSWRMIRCSFWTNWASLIAANLTPLCISWRSVPASR
jgi:hypothetical protein